MAADRLLRRQHGPVVVPNQSGGNESSARDARPVVPGELYPLTDLPSRPWMPKKNGKKVSRFTCIRWALRGKRGLKLRTIMVGGLRVTCDAWVWAFFESLDGSAPATAMNPRRQTKDHELAEAELTAEGIG